VSGKKDCNNIGDTPGSGLAIMGYFSPAGKEKKLFYRSITKQFLRIACVVIETVGH